MSLVPLMFRDWWEDSERPSRLLDQHFGLGLRRDDLVTPPLSSLLRSHYVRPWRLNRSDSGTSALSANQDNFQVILDVQQFAPSELSVKVTDQVIVVEGAHEEKADEHGYISRTFRRRYVLPDNVDLTAVSSNLSSDGVLTITAPKKKQLPAGERPVPIMQTGVPALSPAPQAPAPQAPFPASCLSSPPAAPQAPAAPASAGVTTNIRIDKE